MSTIAAPLRVDAVSDLVTLRALDHVIGPVAAAARVPLSHPGFSGSRIEALDVALASGERRSLVLKHVKVADDWTLRLGGDRVGREGALLAEASLAGVWSVFACPYLAYAWVEGEYAVLMEDLRHAFLPDVREPVSESQEEALLGALARLHARFWESPALELPWLNSPALYADLLAPHWLDRPDILAMMPPGIRDGVTRGWAAALRLLSPRAATLMRLPADALTPAWADLPRTLFHGDAKVANLALMRGGRVAAIDWAMTGAGTAAADLGWYLAVNATRLARSKETVAGRYRSHLEAALGTRVPEVVWDHTMRVAVVLGARLLLWSKARNLESGSAQARAEWAWWAERLDEAGSVL